MDIVTGVEGCSWGDISPTCFGDLFANAEVARTGARVFANEKVVSVDPVSRTVSNVKGVLVLSRC